MIRRWFRQVCGALGAMIVLSGAAAPMRQLLNGGKLDWSVVAAVEKSTQAVRELKLKHEVAIIVVSPARVSRMLADELGREYTPEQLDVDSRAGAMLGLYPSGTDLTSANLNLLASQLIAFYDFGKRRMVIVERDHVTESAGESAEGAREQAAVDRMILAHEFTHALQDQNFALAKKDRALHNNGDRELALHAIAEGDATIAGYADMLGKISVAGVDLLVANLAGISGAFAREVPNVPLGVSEPLIFQYTDGVRFVAEAYRRGGWKAVDALYANPPLSTQQVINPASYFDKPEAPVRVSVAGYEKALAGWRKVDEDTYGELSLRIIFKRLGDSRAADQGLIDQWAGDRIVILRKGGIVGVIWLIAFRDTASAARFATVYGGMIERVDGAAGVAHGIEARRCEVIVAAGGLAAHFDSFAPAVLDASTMSGEWGRADGASGQVRADRSPGGFIGAALR